MAAKNKCILLNTRLLQEEENMADTKLLRHVSVLHFPDLRGKQPITQYWVDVCTFHETTTCYFYSWIFVQIKQTRRNVCP